MCAADAAFRCRSELAELFHLDNPEHVVFTLNATHALNIAIKSLIPSARRVVISGYEHNAVTRPLEKLETEVIVARAPLFQQKATALAFQQLITSGVDAVVCNHVSNVFGFVQPIEEIADICKRKGVPLIIDASQSAGVLPLNMSELGAAFIAMPGHKPSDGAEKAQESEDGFCEYVILRVVANEDGSSDLVSVDDDEEFDDVADLFDDMFSEEIDYDVK